MVGIRGIMPEWVLEGKSLAGDLSILKHVLMMMLMLMMMMMMMIMMMMMMMFVGRDDDEDETIKTDLYSWDGWLNDSNLPMAYLAFEGP